jgi:small conductance mechanosensitive channel
MDAIIQKASDVASYWGPMVLSAIVTFVIGWLVARFLRGVLRRVLTKAKIEETLTSFLTSLFYLALMTLVVIAVIGKLGVETTSFIAVLGAATLAIGFALQGSLGNFAAGVMLIVFRPFKVGDYVEAAGTAGVIEEIQVFATTMRTPDNKTIVVPNAAITAGNITNYATKPMRRVDMIFGISYEDDLRKAKKILSDILDGDTRVLKDPAPAIVVAELADSSVNIAVRPWVKTEDYWNVFFDVTEAAKLEFDAQGITIPYPQRDVHMHSAA